MPTRLRKRTLSSEWWLVAQSRVACSLPIFPAGVVSVCGQWTHPPLIPSCFAHICIVPLIVRATFSFSSALRLRTRMFGPGKNVVPPGLWLPSASPASALGLVSSCPSQNMRGIDRLPFPRRTSYPKSYPRSHPLPLVGIRRPEAQHASPLSEVILIDLALSLIYLYS